MPDSPRRLKKKHHIFKFKALVDDEYDAIFADLYSAQELRRPESRFRTRNLAKRDLLAGTLFSLTCSNGFGQIPKVLFLKPKVQFEPKVQF